MRIKRGDRKPDLTIDLTSRASASAPALPVDLTSATTVKVIGTGIADFVDSAPTVTPLTGRVVHLWQLAETDTSGRIMVEVEVTWPGGVKQTFPPLSYLLVEVVDDLG